MRKPGWRAAQGIGALMLVLLAFPFRLLAAESQERQEWSARLAAIEGQLRHGQWEPARQAAQALAESLAQTSGGTRADHRANADELSGALSDPEPRPQTLALARASAFLALAEAALDRPEEASWHWYLAQNLDRTLRSFDLAPYGRAGAFLGQNLLASAEALHADVTDVLDPVRPEKAGFQEPVRTRAVYPKRPRDLSARDRFSIVVFVQVTIDAAGRVVQPLVVDAAYYPGLVYEAFEALRDWRFRPATLNGEPIPFRYVVPVPFADDRPEQSAVFFN